MVTDSYFAPTVARYIVRSTLTATYNANDTNALDAIKEAEQIIQNFRLGHTSISVSRKDVTGTRTTAVKNDSVGTLTANALGNININAEATLPIKNVTSGKDITIKADGNILAADKNSFTIFSEVMSLNAKHVHVFDGDPAGGDEEEYSDNNTSPILTATTSNTADTSTSSTSDNSTDSAEVSTARAINQLDKVSHDLTSTNVTNSADNLTARRLTALSTTPPVQPKISSRIRRW